ncbi:MAG: response regulator [Candidatus Omnitrophota bacterium]|nr:response regulator [Candidatus Omnitrophota bacterium]
MARKILVVDDEVDFLEVIKIRLEANGYNVVTAGNGEDALKKLKDEKPDAVLLDILMPGIDGLEVLRRIRKMDENLPVYIITAFSTEERFKVANKFGASGFIVKTDDLGKQIKSINSVLDMAQRYHGKKE